MKVDNNTGSTPVPTNTAKQPINTQSKISRLPQVTLYQLRLLHTHGTPKGTPAPIPGQPLTQSVLSNLDKAADRLTSLLRWAESLPPDQTNGLSLKDDSIDAVSGQNAKTSLQLIQDFGKKLMDGVRAELDKQG